MDLKTEPHESIYSPSAFEFMQGGGHVCVYTKPVKLGHSVYNVLGKRKKKLDNEELDRERQRVR